MGNEQPVGASWASPDQPAPRSPRRTQPRRLATAARLPASRFSGQEPRTVRVAVALMAAMIVMFVIDRVAGLVTSPAVGSAYVGTLVSGLFLVLYGWLAVLVLRGTMWARDLTCILLGVSVAFTLTGLLSALAGDLVLPGALATVFGAAHLLFGVAVIVLLVLPRSNAYFRRYSS